MEKSAAPSLASQQSSNGIAMAPKSVEDIDACVTPTSFSSPKAKNKGLRNWIHDHQLLFSVTGIIAIVLLHTLSSPFQRHAGPFIELSYFNPSQGTFGRGADDAYFVAMSVLLFTAVRAICVDYIFRPFAAARGLKPKAAIRFAEQGWQFVYYFTYWTFGMYLWTTSHYWLNFAEIWSDWPVRETSASIKIYTLSQLAFWFQQILVLNMERVIVKVSTAVASQSDELLLLNGLRHRVP
ncbi:sphingosine N-acyltransferase lag1 [Ascosphaera pollenicola]|nr:sphingosine N-acyltransferase lag1 [Ascosphaera pollenicola]